KPGNQLGTAHLLQIVDGQRLGRVDQARNLETVRGHVDLGMAVMLRREELIFGRERARERPGVKEASIDGGIRIEVRWEFRERNHALALGEHGKRPLRNTEYSQPRQGHAAFQYFPAGALLLHVCPFHWINGSSNSAHDTPGWTGRCPEMAAGLMRAGCRASQAAKASAAADRVTAACAPASGRANAVRRQVVAPLQPCSRRHP